MPAHRFEPPMRVAGAGSAMVDFWVELRDQVGGEFWLFDGGEAATSRDRRPGVLRGLRVRVISPTLLGSFEVPLSNWAQIRLCRNKAVEDNGVMAPLHIQLQTSTLRKVLKRLHYPLEVMLLCVRWYVTYPLSLRNLEEMMAERGVEVDHATVHRWALEILPMLSAVFRRRKRPVGSSWRCDETYVKVGGQWKYLYRAVDKLGHTVDFLLTAKRDLAAARRFFHRAIDLHDMPEKLTIDKSGANTAAVHGLIDDSGVTIELRQSKYLNNLIEQDHRAVKRRTRPMLGFKDFRSAAKIIAGIETSHMIRKGQLACPEGPVMSAANQFYSLAV
jgi:transposase-like protein